MLFSVLLKLRAKGYNSFLIKSLIIFLCFACQAFSLFSQELSPIIEAQKCYGWTELLGDEGVKSIFSLDGNLIVTGKKTLFNRETYWVAKTNLKGDIIWETCIFNTNFTANYKPVDIVQNSLGELYVVGTSMEVHNLVYSNYNGTTEHIVQSKGYFDILVCKLTSSGEPIWEKNMGGSSIDLPRKLVLYSDTNLFICGESNSTDGDLINTDKNSSTYNKDVFVVSLDSSGNVLYKKCFGGNGEETLADAKLSQDGSLMLVGSSTSNDSRVSPNNGSSDVYFLRITPELQLINYVTFGGTKAEEGRSIVELESGNVLIAINSTSVDGTFLITNTTTFPNNDKNNIWFFRLNQQNDILSKKYFGGSENDVVNFAKKVSTNDIVFVGKTVSSNGDITDRSRNPSNVNFTADLLLMKIDTSLNKVWERTIGGTNEDEGFHFLEVGQNNFYVCGTTQSINGDVVGNHVNNSDNKDFWFTNLFVPCQQVLNLAQTLSATNETFPAQKTINSIDKISSTSRIDYKAGKQINLMPGFKADNGSVMNMKIDACKDTSTVLQSNPIQVKVNYECREGGMKFVFRPFSPDTVLNSFRLSVENLDPLIPFDFSQNSLITKNNSPLNAYNAYYLLTVSRNNYKDFTYQGYTSTCQHDGNPLECPENTHDLILNKQYYNMGDTIIATWTGGLGDNTGMNWFNDGVNTISATNNSFTGTIISFPVKIQAQPSFSNYPKPCHGGVVVLIRK